TGRDRFVRRWSGGAGSAAEGAAEGLSGRHRAGSACGSSVCRRDGAVVEQLFGAGGPAGPYWNGDAVGVLLTGMGRDGAQGLKLMRQRGFLTIAQDQRSCAVYGMPKAAAAIDAAKEIRPLDTIAPRLTE
nr:hypothetical protein [Tanacetum cinerariifolium]